MHKTRFKLLLLIGLAASQAVAVAGQPQAGAAASGPGDGGRGLAYGLFAKSGPASDWSWQPLPGSLPAVTWSTRGGAGGTLRFALPVKALPGFKADAVRAGVATGPNGSEPRLWLTPAKPFDAPAEAAPGTADLAFGDAALRHAAMSVGDDRVVIELDFDAPPLLRSPWDLYVLIDTDGDRRTGFLGGDFLLQNTTLNDSGPQGIDLAWFELQPGILKPGEPVVFTARVHNASAKEMPSVELRLLAPDGLSVADKALAGPFRLRPGEVKRAAWRGAAAKTGLFRVAVEAVAGGDRLRRSQWLSVVAARDPKREFETAGGAWFPFPARPTFQLGNLNALREFEALPSARLARNLFGITAQLPRTTNEEDPFLAAHAADGDPATCWGSRWWRTEVPFTPEWVEVDLGAPQTAAEFRFLPAWKNSGAPLAFKVRVSADGQKWDTVADETDYQLTAALPGSPLRYGELSWQRFAFAPRPVRFARLTATRLRAGGTSFFCAPFEPYQLRIAEMGLFDARGQSVAAARKSVRASSTHCAWYNRPDTIARTWPLLLKSGVKLNRIGQWGDKTDWATVEKTKGVYRIDPEVDRAINQSVKAGVEILMTLDYGNNLYQTLKDAPDFGPTWHRGHPFLQCAPTTPQAIQGFANYCAFMARHFRGRVKYFEIWNEENGWFFDAWKDNGKVSLVRAYGRALAAAAKAVKQANPEAKVLFGGTAGSTLDFPRLALAEGAGPWLEIFAFHPYGHPTPEAAPTHFLAEVQGKMDWTPRPAGVADYEQEIAAFKKLLRAYNPKMEVWADEMNWFAPGEPALTKLGDLSELTQAKHLARFFALNSWLGCGAIWWSLYNANGVQEWAVLRSSDLTPRAAYFSARYVATLLDDVQGVSGAGLEVAGKVPDNLMVKAYRDRRGQLLIGLWLTSAGADNCRPVPVSLRLPAAALGSAEAIDSLYGRSQPAVILPDSGSSVLPDLLVGDWPLFVRATPPP